MEEAHQQVLSEQKPRVVWVTGLSGEGKSTLVETFLKPLRKSEEILVLSGRCYDRESIPFKAVDCIIESLVRYLRSGVGRWLESEQPEDVEFLAQVFPLLRRVNWIEQRKIHHLTRMEPQAIRGRAFYGLRQLLIAISQHISVAIHVDDLQWGDADSARAWHELLNQDDTPPLLVLASYRSDEADESPFLQAWKQQTTSVFHRISDRTVAVESLTAEECLEVAALRTGLPQESIQAQVAQLFEETAGNPYFLDQLLEGFDPATGSFRPVPLDEIVAGRLSRLPVSATRLLEVIAVSGQPLPITEAAAVAEASSVATLTHMRIERLVRLLDVGVERMVETWHDKVRESVLSQLPPERQQHLHLRLAEEIESQQEKRADDWLDTLRRIPTPGEYEFPVSDRVLDLSRHFAAAGDQRAFVYQWLAGEQAMRAYAVEEANAFFEQARALLPHDESQRLKYRFWMGCGRVSLWKKSSEVSTDSYQTAVNFAHDQFEKAQAYVGLESVCMQLGHFNKAIEWADLALTELGMHRPRTTVGQLISILEKNVRLYFIPQRWQIARTDKQRRNAGMAHSVLLIGFYAFVEKGAVVFIESMARSSLNALKTGNEAKTAMGLIMQAQINSAFGLVWMARSYFRRARKLESTVSDPEVAGKYYLFNGMAEYYSGRLQNAEPLFEQSYHMLERCCRFEDLQTSYHMHRHTLAYLGDSRVEEKKARTVLELATTTGNVQGICFGLYDVAGAVARAGRLSEAAYYMQRANRSLPEGRFIMTSAIRASTDGYTRLQCSDYVSSRRLSEFAWSLIMDGKIAMDNTLQCVAIMVESTAGSDWLHLLPITEKRSLKRALRRAMLSYLLLPNQQAHIDRVRGRAYWRLGKQRKAIRHFEKAVRIAEKKGMKYQQAKSLLDLAAVKEEGREENRAEAIELLKQMESVIPRAESWLLGDQYDETVVAPEFDLEAWEREHGPIATDREEAYP